MVIRHDSLACREQDCVGSKRLGGSRCLKTDKGAGGQCVKPEMLCEIEDEIFQVGSVRSSLAVAFSWARGERGVG